MKMRLYKYLEMKSLMNKLLLTKPKMVIVFFHKSYALIKELIALMFTDIVPFASFIAFIWCYCRFNRYMRLC